LEAVAVESGSPGYPALSGNPLPSDMDLSYDNRHKNSHSRLDVMAFALMLSE
jgi:hypothetical protein